MGRLTLNILLSFAQFECEATTERGRTKEHGGPVDMKYLYRLLNNRVYNGEAVYKGDR